MTLRFPPLALEFHERLFCAAPSFFRILICGRVKDNLRNVIIYETHIVSTKSQYVEAILYTI